MNEDFKFKKGEEVIGLVDSVKNQYKEIVGEINEKKALDKSILEKAKMIDRTIYTIDSILNSGNTSEAFDYIVQAKESLEDLKNKYKVLNEFIKKNSASEVVGDDLDSDSETPSIDDKGIPEKLADSTTIVDVYKKTRMVLKATGNDNVFRMKYGDETGKVADMKNQLSKMIENESNNNGSKIRQDLESAGIWQDVEDIAA